jgi:hypothetical protein
MKPITNFANLGPSVLVRQSVKSEEAEPPKIKPIPRQLAKAIGESENHVKRWRAANPELYRQRQRGYMRAYRRRQKEMQAARRRQKENT